MAISTRRALTVSAATAALALALSGCSMLNVGTNNAQRDDEGNVTEESNIDVFSLKIGDCVPAATAEGEVSEVPVVPCDEPHGHQVYDEFSLPDGDFPTEEAVTTAATDYCTGAFEKFVGVAYDASTLDISWYSPTQSGWEEANDRLVQCIIFDPASETIEGTLEGAKR